MFKRASNSLKKYKKSILRQETMLVEQREIIEAFLRREGLLTTQVDGSEVTDIKQVPNLLQPKPSGKKMAVQPKLVGHEDIWKWLGSVANNSNIKVLEIGSRAVASDFFWRSVAPNADYVGFDYIDGKNVDVVGDAHSLSSYFADEFFDIVISSAVFEHLAMPWIVAEEISKVLKVGGHVVTETHFAFKEHELPWNFFQFHFEGLKVLFNERLGFETIDFGFSNPLVAWFSAEASEYLRGQQITDIYCHSHILSRKIETVIRSGDAPFDWRSTLSDLQKSSSYPKKTGLSAND